jgi:hypothetical protein
MAVPSARIWARNSFISRLCTGSRPENGSSITSRCGRWATVAAKPTICACPRERVLRGRSKKAPNPSRSSVVRAAWAASAGESPLSSAR